MSQSESGKSDPVLEGVELLFYMKGGLASFGAKMVLPLNGLDPGYINSITESTSRAKCLNILDDKAIKSFIALAMNLELPTYSNSLKAKEKQNSINN